jgi:hypothetical protein
MFFLIVSIFFINTVFVVAQDQPAIITGSITDQAVDLNDDGMYDVLKIGVEINVTMAGRYSVEVFGLYDDSANYVEVSNINSTYLDQGIQVVDVSLDGSIIYSSGLNLNTIAIIELDDENDNEIDVRYDHRLSKTYSFFEFQSTPAIFSFDKVERRIMLDQESNIYIANFLSITNLGSWANSINVDFPDGAYEFEVRDEMGTLDTTIKNNIMNVTFRKIIFENETENIYMNYKLKREDYITQQNGIDYSLTFSFYEEFNSTIKELTTFITLPKGGMYQSSTNQNPESIEKLDFEETIKFSFSNVSPSENLNFMIKYKYNVFWGSFYPTIWVGIFVVIATIGFFIWGSPKTISTSTVSIPTSEIRNFVKTYEEKMNIQSELISIEERLKKGKIQRRKYKVRKKMLDSRFSSISKNLSISRSKLIDSGPKYRRMMNEIEVAETKLDGTEKDIQRIKLRYQRGEISKNSYNQLLTEYQERIEEAESTIEGVLLRLRD